MLYAIVIIFGGYKNNLKINGKRTQKKRKFATKYSLTKNIFHTMVKICHQKKSLTLTYRITLV
jgi:hypothetical protein